MKKSIKLQKYGIAVVAFIVAIALMLACFTLAMPRTAKAALGDKAEVEAERVTLLDKVSIKDTCKYGEKFDVKPGETGVDVTVKAPNGATVTPVEGKVTADQVGNYTVTYTQGKVSQSFNVYVTLDEEYFLKVDYDGADIPTYIKKGSAFTLPAAKVAYYDEDNVLRFYPADATTLEIRDSLNNTYEAGGSLTANVNGKLYVTYSAVIGGTTGTKRFNKTFTVNVQTNFNDTAAPTLSVSGVTTDISVNRPVTLPKATATDSYDENVKIEIKVVDPNGNNVKTVDIDRYGYGYQQSGKTYDDVSFDNDKAMTFYPLTAGDYTVSYVATDDSGNKSAVREYHMTAKDLAAPVFEEVEDWRIPETWGMEVKKTDGNSVVTATGLGGKISFPIPTVVDNKDHAYPESEGDDNLISLYFRITDADNSRVIVEFTNILAASDSADCKFAGNSVYGVSGTDYVFNKDTNNGLFEFDFNQYHKLDSAGEAAELPGSYTVYYRARDKAQNTSSKTYTIKLEETFTDDAAPSTAEVTVPSYVSESDEEFTVPSPAVADAKDSRPHVEYRLYSKPAGAAEAGYITVKGGEKGEFERRSGDLYLVVDKDKTERDGSSCEKALKLGDTLYYYVAVTDKVGNFKRNTEDNSEDYTKCENTSKVVSSAAAAVYEYDEPCSSGKITFVSENDDDDHKIYAGDTVKVNFLEIDTTFDMRKYTGFEVAVRDPNGNPLNVTLETASMVDNKDPHEKAAIMIANINFKPSVEGDHTLTVRVFDVNGNNSVYGYVLPDVQPSKSSGTTTTAANIGTTGSVNVKYKLHNEVMTGIGTSSTATYYVARRISGGVFALMGSELTAKTPGSYSITDGWVDGADLGPGYDWNNNVTVYGGNDGTYTVNITDTAAPVIEVQGLMPTYAEKNAEVTLPSVIAYTENGNAKVELKVTNAKSNEVDTTYDEATNTYKFTGTTDGAYTATYTATYENATPVTATYTINIGDVVGPEFDVPAPTGRLTVGNTFTFGTMTLAEGESSTGVTIVKKLIDPSREEVADATVSGSFSSYAASANNGTDITLSMAGQYEVVYTATDAVGNVTTQRYNITVVSSGSGTPTTITTLSTVLIIVAVVLLAGVIVYVVRFRKVKEKK